MPDGAQALYEIGDRIPDVHLPAVGAEGASPLRGGARESVVIVFPHAPDCAACRAYVEGLVGSRAGFRRWDARLIVVLPGDGQVATGGPWGGGVNASTVRDEDGALRPHVGLGCAAVVVADRWGAIYEVVRDVSGHGLPTPHEVVEWLRYIATQCPECGVPDTPGLRTWS